MRLRSVQSRRRFPVAHAQRGAARGCHLTHFRRYDGANSAIGHVVRRQAVLSAVIDVVRAVSRARRLVSANLLAAPALGMVKITNSLNSLKP